MKTNRQKICILSGLLFQLIMGGLSYWVITVYCGLDNFLGLVTFIGIIILTKIIFLIVKVLLDKQATIIMDKNTEQGDAIFEEFTLPEEKLLKIKMDKEDERIKILQEIATYTSLTFDTYFCSEDITIILKGIHSFKESAKELIPIERPLHDLKGLTTKDLYHYGWNVGRRLEKSRDEIAWFLRHLFPMVFANTDHSTIVKKMTNTDGAYRIRCVPLDQSLLELLNV